MSLDMLYVFNADSCMENYFLMYSTRINLLKKVAHILEAREELGGGKERGDEANYYPSLAQPK